MVFYDECDLLIGNKIENDSDEQYAECEDCYRYDICLPAKEREVQ